MILKKENFILLTITILIIFFIPLLFTVCLQYKISLKGFSPLDSTNTFGDYLNKNSWIFSLLNLSRELPYYTVTPSFEGVEPAVIFSSKETGEVIQTIPYDSLTCLGEKLDTANETQVSNLSSINWSDCKFVKDFGWGKAMTDKYKPKLDISIGWIGLFVIYFAILTLWNGFLILLIGSFKEINKIIKKMIKT